MVKDGDGSGEGRAEVAAPESSTAEIIRNLQLHQAELTAQNEELRRVQEALEQSRARYVALYDFAPVAYFGVDLGTIIHEVNLPGAAMLGLERGRLTGLPLGRYVAAPLRSRFRTQLAKVLRTSKPAGFTSTFELPSGQQLEVQLQLRADPPVDGERALCRISASDITPTVEAQRAQTRANERYRALLDGVPDAVFRIERSGTVIARHVPRELTELLPADPRARRISELLPAPLGAEVERRVRSLTGANAPETFECEFPHQGRSRWMEARLLLSGPEEVTALCRDITQLREAEARLRLQERLAALGTLSAGLAHEINNPLGFVLASLELASRSRTHPNPPITVDAALEDARTGVARIRAIVKNLSEFSHPNRVRRTAVDVREALESALAVTAHDLEHRARVIRALGEVPPVLADVRELGQIFVNVLANAAQSLPVGAADQHTVRVTTRPGARDTVIVEIADTGCGMTPEVLARVFEPFFTTKDVGRGVGLGLSIALTSIRSLGGEVAVESQVGQGTVFRVTLPAAREPVGHGAVEAPAPAALPSPRYRVMVIDDHPAFARSLQLLLATSHDATAFVSAQEALEQLLGGERFDVILCDVMMPVMTGRDFYERVEAFSPALAAHVVFMTGGVFTEPMMEFLDSLPNPRLAKPFQHAEMEAALAEVMLQPEREASGS